MAEHEMMREPFKFVAAAAFAEGLAGLCAVALSIIGLASVVPNALLSIATIILGGALLFEAGAVSARYTPFTTQSTTASNLVAWGRWGQCFDGVVGIALGILALLGVAPLILIPVAAIVYGCNHVMDNVINARLNALETRKFGLEGDREETLREEAAGFGGVQVLAGIGAVVLGILALTGIYPLGLSLVAMLGIGSAFLLNGSVVSVKMFSAFHG
jgi:hypothetical protein